MKKTLITLTFSLFGLGFLCGNTEKNDTLSLIPEPASTILSSGHTKIVKIIESQKDPELGAEAYILRLTPKGTIIRYGDKAGLFHAGNTYESILAQYADSPEREIPCLEIRDKPEYSWRALMIDPARHFWKPEDIKKFIDVMAFYKFNILHIHLTDDQGWRLPVPGYPKLETISSKRAETDGDKTPHGGMYTKKELKDLVKYAEERHVQLIPEIDVPGHNQALASAYPEMICFPNPDLKVRTTPGVSKELVCPAKPEVWKFYEVVIKELADIFPSPYVHLGGDEAPDDNWKKCPACAQLREKKGFKSTHEQMGGFFARMTEILKKNNKKPLLWFEEGSIKYPEGSPVYTWRLGKTPSTIAHTREQGLKLICAPGEHCYLDYPQVNGDVPRSGWMPTTTLEQTYKLDPAYNLPQEQSKHIIGVEGTLWGEYVSNLDRAFYMVYPRALALSEAGWSPMNVRSWENFSRKLEFHRPFMQKKWGIDPRRPDKK